ncbi:MAG: SCP2 sterol-binding domain-containing protein [Clostridia bacterium]
MTFLEKFEDIKAMLNVDVKFERNFAIQINMTDDDCSGAFYVKHCNGVFEVQPYTYHDYDAMMTLTSEILYWMLTGEIDSVAAFFEGKFAIDGNLEAVLEFLKVTNVIKAKRKAEKEAKKAKEKKAKEKKTKVAKTKEEAVKVEKVVKTKSAKKEAKQLKLDI